MPWFQGLHWMSNTHEIENLRWLFQANMEHPHCFNANMYRPRLATQFDSWGLHLQYGWTKLNDCSLAAANQWVVSFHTQQNESGIFFTCSLFKERGYEPVSSPHRDSNKTRKSGICEILIFLSHKWMLSEKCQTALFSRWFSILSLTTTDKNIISF